MKTLVIITLFVTIQFLPVYSIENTFTLWTPEHMIKNNTYNGIIILDTASTSGTLTLLSTGNEQIITIQDNISILPHTNHGIFSITPTNEGITQIFATVGDTLQSKTV